MTAQINDVFRHRGHEYAVAGISEGTLFDPALLDLEPEGACSACWRGYVATFGLSDTRLVLADLDVSLYQPGGGYVRQEGPTINGATPSGPIGSHDWFNNHYEGLAHHLEYTGGVLLADGFIRELYVHMGFHPAWKFERVVELVFENGVLRREFDRSEQMAEIRAKVVASGAKTLLPDDDIVKFVEQAFDRRYRM